MANESNQSVTAQPSVVDSSQELPKYLTCRNGIYYFKRRLPEKIAKALKLKSPQVWKSLKTSSLDVAIERLAIQVREFESLLSPTEKNSPKFGGRDVPSTPRGEGTTKYLLEAHIEPMLSRFEYGHLTTDDEERKDMTRDERAERREMLEDGLEGLYDLAAAEDYSTMDEVAEQLLSIERLIAPPGSAAHQLLLKRLLMKDIEVMEIQRDRLKGKMRLTPKVLPEGPRELTTLLDLVKAWGMKQSEVRTIETYRNFVDEFESLNGALPVVAITIEHVRSFRDHLAKDGLVRDTVKNRIGGLSTLVRYGCKEGLCSLLQNPFENVSVRADPILTTRGCG